MPRSFHRISSYISLATASILLASCGGSGAFNSNSIQISWPSRSRQPIVVNLSSALSAKITLSRPDNSGTPVVLNVDRTNSSNSYTGSYALPNGLDPLLTKLTVTFYSQAGQGGVEVGSATANVTITNGVPVLDTIVVDGTIKSVAVVPATLSVGAPASQLAFTALDASNNTVAVSSGSGKWTLTTGGAVLGLTAPGMATPKSAGNATVTVAVDGITSPDGNITVQNFSGQMTWEDITPAGLGTLARVTAVKDSVIVGYTYDMNQSGNFTNFRGFTMNPGITFHTGVGTIDGTDGTSFVGQKFIGTKTHAMLETASTTTDLHPANADPQSRATGVSGDLQVGWAYITFALSDGTVGIPHALAWHGSANSVIDLHPDQFAPPTSVSNSVVVTQALSVSGTLIGGTYNDGNEQACCWTSPSKFSFVDLRPQGSLHSKVMDTNAGRMVGYVDSRPVLWTGPSKAQMSYLDTSGTASYITDNYIFGTKIWNATSLAAFAYVLPDAPAGITLGGSGGIRKTAAGLDVIVNAYATSGGAPKVLVLHVPTNLLP